ncbi:MAG: TraR/DksA C4-type zinc finger protein, partial [Henriciella sp.]|nr:TraR/DksA C4-type zinc finger protein [Henriciella sp.]
RQDRCVRSKLELPSSADLTLAKIEAALDRLDLGTFGLCTHCGDEINLKRLDHDPSVQHCKGCEDGATAR